MTPPKFTPAGGLFADWERDLASRERPPTYPLGAGELAAVEFGPGRVMLVGGAPGAGKTAFVMQAVCHMLAATPGLNAAVCNVEMAPRALLERQLARVARVSLRDIRRRELDADATARAAAGLADLRPLADRLCFVEPPFDLAHIGAAADAFGAGVLVLDYIQRIKPPGKAGTGDKRMQVEASMDAIRAFAGTGLAVVVVAAVARSKDAKGRNSYGNLSLASFRESSELEYGADDAFILAENGADRSRVNLAHLKSRYGETRDIEMRFDRPHQTFIPDGAAPPAPPKRPPASPVTPPADAPTPAAKYKALFDSARPAPESKR